MASIPDLLFPQDRKEEIRILLVELYVVRVRIRLFARLPLLPGRSMAASGSSVVSLFLSALLTGRALALIYVHAAILDCLRSLGWLTTTRLLVLVPVLASTARGGLFFASLRGGRHGGTLGALNGIICSNLLVIIVVLVVIIVVPILYHWY